MTVRYRAWHKTWEELGKVKRIRFDDEGNVTTVLFEGKVLGVDTHADEIELMQSTGLKDKNGKEIFEGDVITNGQDVMCMKRHNTLGFYVEQKGKVEFIAGCAVLEEFEEDAKEIADSLEIIGNIYENPELLEDKE